MLKHGFATCIFLGCLLASGRISAMNCHTGGGHEEHQHEEQEMLKGYCASQGHATGKVKVCRGMEEVAKFKEGEILVACMTQPEYVPAMKKAAAIVTDEGGLTCHAAIISRELGKPCIISTKKATRILKDGMTVEVNATEGWVKILKKKE